MPQPTDEIETVIAPHDGSPFGIMLDAIRRCRREMARAGMAYMVAFAKSVAAEVDAGELNTQQARGRVTTACGEVGIDPREPMAAYHAALADAHGAGRAKVSPW